MKITLEFNGTEQELIPQILALHREWIEKREATLSELSRQPSPYLPGEGAIDENSKVVMELPQIPELSPVTEGVRGDVPFIVTGTTAKVADDGVTVDTIDLKAMFGGQLEVPTAAATTVVPVPPQSPTAHIKPIPPELDKDGFPWDARIHAATKTRNADGTWRTKRGVDKALVNEVTAQLKQLMAIPASGDTRTFPLPLPNVPLEPLTAHEASQIPWPPRQPVVPSVIAALPVVSSAAGSVPVPPPPVAPITNVQNLIMAITGRIAAKTMTQEQVTGALAKVGIPALPLLISRPDLVPAVAAELGL